MNEGPSPQKLPDVQASLLLPSSNEKGAAILLYCTQVAKGTLNPTWQVIETAWIEGGRVPALEHEVGFVLEVSIVSPPPSSGAANVRPNGSAAALRARIEVHKLRRLSIPLAAAAALPINTVALELNDGHLYVPAWVAEAINPLEAAVSALHAADTLTPAAGGASSAAAGGGSDRPPTASNAERARGGGEEPSSAEDSDTPRAAATAVVAEAPLENLAVLGDDTDAEEFAALCRLREEVLAREAATAAMGTQLELALDAVAGARHVELEAKRRAANIERLKAALARQLELFEEEQAALSAEKAALVDDQADLSQLHLEADRAASLQAAREVELGEEAAQHEETQLLLEARQARLVGHLQHIYPISYAASGEWAIRGLGLPADLQSRDDEVVSSALGYVVHLVAMIAKYLQIPLRYQVIYNASRSAVRDNVTGGSTAYPLFKRGVERERFDRAVYLLARDVEQLAAARGVAVKPGQHMLSSLRRLIKAQEDFADRLMTGDT
ncbi:unnamed protein product [Phaeothamnion confervicola]